MAKDERPKPKLPVKQLTILAVARFAEPMAYTSVFPYLPQMIRDFGVEQNEVAKWAGITTSVFSLAQSTTAVAWGRAADVYGRKPALIFGLLSTMICFIAWGMSTSLTMAIAVRTIQGAGNGNVGIIRTMVAEMVTERSLQPKAFSIMPLVWSLGSIVGPSVGGFFAQPAKQWPGIFGNIEFLKQYPYLLPNLVATMFFLVSTSSAFFFLQETLPTKRGREDWGLHVGKKLTRNFRRRQPVTHRRQSFVDGEATAPLLPSQPLSKHSHKVITQQSPRMKEIFTPQTVLNLVSYTFLAFHCVAYDQCLPVFMHHPVKKHTAENTSLPFKFNGGFGLDEGEIGTIFTIYGVVCGLVQFLVYSPLVTRYGVLKCFRACALFLPIIYFITPYTVLLPTGRLRVAAIALAMCLKGFGAIIAFPSTTILLTNSCSSLRILGTLNGFATMFSGLGRAAGPASTGWVFSWGAEHNYAVSAWFFLGVIALIGAIPVFFIQDGPGPSASTDNSEDEDSAIEDTPTSTRDSGIFTEESTVVGDDDETSQSSPLMDNGKKQSVGYNTMASSR
ncbi:major facilitator superfamily protein [Stachybotrys elegans]|uniref:Major facilitator superfamily protein n=1 Tax=Stachybotrys elegans TaxID=80388 RepID=A0A8K0SZZ4_9HYPO|nr:major facilitator superfamily protein [Stachybotrys elegans]